MTGFFRLFGLAALAAVWAAPAQAAELDGSKLSLLFAVPFAGILLSILAIAPLVASDFWHHHYGKVALFWAALLALPLAYVYGAQTSIETIFHVLALEYIPFILLLLALFTAAGGLAVRGNLHGSPAMNTGLLATGAFLASIIGTTGAAMVLIRPLLRANDDRNSSVHVVIFFIFLVGNIGGALTPLGDPPLFLGFLRGVDFFWTTEALALPTLFSAGILLIAFFLFDSWLYKREGGRKPDPTPDDRTLHLTGTVNLVLIAVIVGAVVLSGVWKPGISFEILHTKLELQNLVREALLIGVTVLSLLLSRKADREANDFNWEPIREVAKLFAAIFVCIVPVIEMLKAGTSGPFAALSGLVTTSAGTPNNLAYFWLTGGLSAVLDNAPTYVVFFELAGGNPAQLMGPLAGTLAAISMGAVYMGALTYIGNAPNFMIYAVARHAGVPMPGFFGYMVWSFAILLPVFALLSFVFLR